MLSVRPWRMPRARVCVYMALAGACALVAFVIGQALIPQAARAGGSSVVVSMTVPSETSLTNNCTATPAWNFGVVLPGSDALTATGANACSFDFSSTNDSAALYVGQRDASDDAAGMRSGTFVAQAGDSALQTGIAAFNSSIAYSVTVGGKVSVTTDGGATWTAHSTGFTGAYGGAIAVSPTNSQHVWIVGGKGEISKSTDGGATWTEEIGPDAPAPQPTNQTLFGVVAVSDSVLWACGGNGVILHTTNGGATWTVQSSGTTATLRSITALPAAPATAFAAGTSSTVLRTTNSGATWTPVSTAGNYAWYGIAEGSTGTLFLSGYGGYVAATTNSGASWDIQKVGQFPGILRDVAAANATTAWAVGPYGYIYETTDAGTTWTLDPVVDATQLLSVAAIPSGSAPYAVFASGYNGTFLKTTNGSTWSISQRDAQSAALFGASGRDQNVVYAVGSVGQIDYTTDGGSTWITNTPASTAHTLWSVAAIDDTHAVAVGDGGTILTGSDNSSAWTLRTSGTGATLYDVAALSDGETWAVGGGGVLLHSVDGGATWTAQDSGTANNLYGVSAVSDKDVWAVGASGTIIHTTDGGSTWTAQASGTGTDFRSVSAVNATTAYAANTYYENALYKTTDGGTTWTSLATPVGTLTAVAAVTADTVFITFNGYLYWSDDGGMSWGSALVPSSLNINAIVAADANTIYAVGQSNQIAKMSPINSFGQYNAATNGWGTGTGSMFAVCLQSVGGAATAQAWSVDPSPPCAPYDITDSTNPHQWYALSTSPTKIAATNGAGDAGDATLVWGLRPAADQPPGDYSATVSVEVIAPAV